MSAHTRALVQGLVVVIAAQWMGVLAKLALFEVPAFTFVWLQLAAAGLFMLLYTLVFARERWPSGLAPADWLAIAFIGVVNFGLCRVLMMMSIERLPMNTFVFVLSFVSLVTMGLSVVFLGEHPGRRQMLGVVLAIVGVWLFFPDVPPPAELRGVVYALLIVFGLGATNNVTRWLLTRQGDGLTSSLLSTLALPIGAIPIILAGLTLDWPPPVGGARNAWIIVANGVVGIALTQTVFNAVLRTLRSYEASVLAGSGLIWTALLAIPILGEWLEWRQIAAIGVVLSGVVMTQRRPAEGR
ncbi:MAG: DMT family transporter [bacterium]|nr:hypothetical protein [Deltaproteobacteria bacterium]MCP4905193.1 DMT family transporter [bacterium]